MSRELTSLSYRECQIIKHALQHYIKRDSATSKDIEQENKLLNRIENLTYDIEKKYRIK